MFVSIISAIFFFQVAFSQVPNNRDCVDSSLTEIRSCVRDKDRLDVSYASRDDTTSCCPYLRLLNCARIVLENNCGRKGVGGLARDIADSFVSIEKQAQCRQYEADLEHEVCASSLSNYIIWTMIALLLLLVFFGSVVPKTKK